MNRNILQGNWDQLVGQVRSKWGELTDDDLLQVKGDAQQLKGKLEERYGWTKEQAEREVDDWLKTMDR